MSLRHPVHISGRMTQVWGMCTVCTYWNGTHVSKICTYTTDLRHEYVLHAGDVWAYDT